jgi:uncharacterized linocin/CFP29 family protein
MRYLNRDAAPISEKAWKVIDDLVVETGRSTVVGRRILPLQGPSGLGFRAIKKSADAVVSAPVEEAAEARAGLVANGVVAIPQIYFPFRLSIASVEAFDTYDQPLDLDGAFRAARLCAQQEDRIVFWGDEALGIPGLMSLKGRHEVKVGNWDTAGAAIDDVIKALGHLDGHGFTGPYALAVGPRLYNALLRKYPDSDVLQLEHLRGFITKGIVKAPILGNDGLLIDASVGLNDIVIGQDLITAFAGYDGLFYSFTVLESVLPRIKVPEAICVLNGSGAAKK